MQIYIIRHGSTEMNEQHMLRGWLNPELSELGVQQSQLISDYFSDEDVSKIYSSDLRRATQTAEMFSDTIGMPFEETEALRPINFGDLQGKPLRDIASDMGKLMTVWQFDPNIKAPGGESFRTFQDRTYDFLTGVIKDAKEDDCILLITHVRVCLYVAQLVMNEFEKLKGNDLDRINTLDVYPGNFIKIDRLEEDDVIRLCGINQLDQDGIESEESPVVSELGT